MPRFDNASSWKVRSQLQLEWLEDRVVPSGTTLDLTTRGSFGEVGEAVFRQINARPTGTGVIQSFLRLQAQGANANIEQGFNTDARPVEFDEKTSPPFTRSLRLSEIPVVNMGGINYREFLLDINETGSQPQVSLDELRLYTAEVPDLTGYDPATHELGGHAPIYDLDVNGDQVIVMNYRLNSGSGSGDVLVYVADHLFGPEGGNPYVYLYSKLGDSIGAKAGFEEWAVGSAPLTSGLGSISGHVFEDLNEDQLFGQDEMPLHDWLVFIDANDNGYLDDNEVYTTTNEYGEYTFDNLVVGLGDLSTYRIREVLQDGWTQTTPNPVDIVLTSPGQSVEDVDFGNFMEPIFEE